MLLWIVFAILTAAAVALVALPLARRQPAAGESASGPSPDLAVYKAQLGELDRDVERGVIAVIWRPSRRAPGPAEKR